MAPVQQGGKLKAPLLPRAAGDGAATCSGGRVDGEGASFQGAVLNLSTTIIGAGIMSIPATVKVLGVVPALLVILVVAFLSDVSIEFLLRFTDAGTSTSYSGVMSESFGRLGRLILQMCVAITTMGTTTVYLIIIGDVLSGSMSEDSVNVGLLQEWFGTRWWNTREWALLFTCLLVLLPLVSFRRVDKASVPGRSMAVQLKLSVHLAFLSSLLDTIWVKFDFACPLLKHASLNLLPFLGFRPRFISLLGGEGTDFSWMRILELVSRKV